VKVRSSNTSRPEKVHHAFCIDFSYVPLLWSLEAHIQELGRQSVRLYEKDYRKIACPLQKPYFEIQFDNSYRDQTGSKRSYTHLADLASRHCKSDLVQKILNPLQENLLCVESKSADTGRDEKMYVAPALIYSCVPLCSGLGSSFVAILAASAGRIYSEVEV